MAEGSAGFSIDELRGGTTDYERDGERHRSAADPAAPLSPSSPNSQQHQAVSGSYVRDSSHQAAPAVQGGQLVTIELQDIGLWEEFRTCPTEMVVTKQGRRMFPVVTVSVKGLRPEAMYSVFMDMILVDNYRWKYHRGEWVPGCKADQPHATIYRHPDSPHYGSHWMKNPVSFTRVKLTNKPGDGGHLVLNSLHKYEARVHVVPEQGQALHPLPCIWKSFPETQFIAVTAYQNDEVTRLKVKHNPYAKAFTEQHKKSQKDDDPSSLQPIHPHRFGDDHQPGEIPDEGDMSEGGDMAISPHPLSGYPQVFMASTGYDQEFMGSMSAPTTLARDAEMMDIDETPRNAQSLPVDSEPQNFPSTYYIRHKNGQIVVCDPVQSGNGMHLPLSPPQGSTGEDQIPAHHPHIPASQQHHDYVNCEPQPPQQPRPQLQIRTDQPHHPPANMAPAAQQLSPGGLSHYQHYNLLQGNSQNIAYQQLSPRSPPEAMLPGYQTHGQGNHPGGVHVVWPHQQMPAGYAYPQLAGSAHSSAFPIVPSGQVHPLLQSNFTRTEQQHQQHAIIVGQGGPSALA